MKRARLALTACAAALVLAVAPGREAGAYMQAGHFRSISLVVDLTLNRVPGETVPFSPEEERLVAFCAQLPDLSIDLDASATYASMLRRRSIMQKWWGWGVNDDLGDARVRRMFAVQQVQHVLTGGNAEVVESIATSVLRRKFWDVQAATGEARGAALCALGFAFHMYGDSFAHRYLPGQPHSLRDEMYPTGRGHALIHGNAPDYPPCDRARISAAVWTRCAMDTGPRTRFEAWLRYWARVPDLLRSDAVCQNPRCAADAAGLAALEGEITRQAATITATDPKEADGELAAILAADRPASGQLAALDQAIDDLVAGHGGLWDAIAGHIPSCDENLSELARRLSAAAPQTTLQVPRCRQAWMLFATEAARQLDASSAARADQWSTADGAPAYPLTQLIDEVLD